MTQSTPWIASSAISGSSTLAALPLVALDLVLLMTGAAITRIRRHEFTLMVVDLVYIVLAAFTLWRRFGSKPFIN
ncbi:hypothetical protein [Streptacidiphilus sp. EB103A]|uniref:hypothetical protein n=1 Tax=Streptacidiphilus sp. EB103A TaxID=3156275 RepID=UPI0035134A66